MYSSHLRTVETRNVNTESRGRMPAQEPTLPGARPQLTTKAELRQPVLCPQRSPRETDSSALKCPGTARTVDCPRVTGHKRDREEEIVWAFKALQLWV